MIILKPKSHIERIQTEFLQANRPGVRVCGLGGLVELITELATEGDRHELFKADLSIYSGDGAAAGISSHILTYLMMQDNKASSPSVKC